MNQFGTEFGGFLKDIYGFEKELVIDEKEKLKEDEEAALKH